MLAGACYIFEIVLFFCRWESRSFFSLFDQRVAVLLWLGPWSRMTRNSSVDECVSTDDSPTLTRSVGLQCIFRSSTHVRYDRTVAAIAHLKVLHACDIVAPFRRQCRVTTAMSAPQRGLRGAVCCLNICSLFRMYVIREWSIRTNYVRRTPPLVDTSGDSLRSVGTFHSFAFCQRFARVFLHTSLFVARTYNISWQCPNLEHKCAGTLSGRV